jgi:hypothetical protein
MTTMLRRTSVSNFGASTLCLIRVEKSLISHS